MNLKAVGLKEAARRCNIAYSTARKRMADGTFPVPALRRYGHTWHKFSEKDIEAYLNSGTEDAKPAKKGRAA